MSVEKEYINNRNVYFSGQGTIVLEFDEKVVNIGNSSLLLFYDDGNLDIRLESWDIENLKLFFGDSKGEESVYLHTEQSYKNLTKFTCDFSKKIECVLTFEGVNTAASRSRVVVKTPVTLNRIDCLDLINEKLSDYSISGTWNHDFELFVDTQGYEKPPFSLSRYTNFLYFKSNTDPTKDFMINLSLITKVSACGASSCVIELPKEAITVPFSVQSIMYEIGLPVKLSSPEKYEKETKGFTHAESGSGGKFVDYKG